MRQNDPSLDLKAWPLEEPLPSRKVPRRADIEATLEVVRKSLRKANAPSDLVEEFSVTAIGKTYELWRKREQPWEQLTGYAIEVARNEVTQHFRKSSREMTLGDQVAERLVTTDALEHADIDLRDWIGKLPETDQALMQMKIKGDTQERMANLLGISQSGVSQRLERLEKRLRRYLLWRD